MSIGEGPVADVRPVGRRRGVRLSVLGMLGLVAVAGVLLGFYRHLSQTMDPRPSLLAKFVKTAPVLDGVIGPKEYGSPVAINWAGGNTLTDFEHNLSDPTKSPVPGDLTTAPWVTDSTTSKTPADLSIEAYAAYTSTSLFLAFKVRDQFVDAQEEDARMPFWNDSIELFIDADHVANDFSLTSGTSEGFQLVVDAAGHQYTKSSFTDADWRAAARRTADGYIVEVEIPLALIDTKDGPGAAPPGPGALLHFGMAITDNDENVSKQTSYAYLRTPRQTSSPYHGREPSWTFGIELESRWLPW
jgi:hypothetical protein